MNGTHDSTHDSTICRRVQQDPRGENWDDLMRAHAASCAACQSFVTGADELARRLQARPDASAVMPAAMRARLLAELGDNADKAAPTATPRSRPSLLSRARVLVPVAMAASLVLGVFLESRFEIVPRPLPVEVDRSIGMYITDVTHDHYLLERIGRPLEVAMTDPAELSGWLSHSLSFGFNVPPSAGDLALEGGRVWHTVGRLSALASYRAPSGERVVLFAVPAANLALEGATVTTVDGRQVFEGAGWGREARVWIEGDLAMALVAPEGGIPADWSRTFLSN